MTKIKLIRYNEKIHNSNPEYSITYKGKDTFNVFKETADVDLGTHHISRIKANMGLSDSQLDYVKKHGTTNFKVVKTNKKKSDESVKVQLYGSWKKYPNIEVAKKDMLDAIRNSEGSERERYTYAYDKLSKGLKVVKDKY
jgi:hypothetical protein